MTNKKELRLEIRNRKRQYSPSQLGELSLSVVSRLWENSHLQAAHTILIYYSLPDEVDTHSLADELLEKDKKVILPVVTGEGEMELREYTGRKDLREGPFHILEPIGRLFPEKRYGEIELGVIPGMSFDRHGNRLGRGKGYYDRFLEKVPQMHKIGLCFDFQKVETIPTEPTDIPMDEIV